MSSAFLEVVSKAVSIYSRRHSEASTNNAPISENSIFFEQ